MSDIFIKTKYFMPNDYKKTIFDIDFVALKSQGIEGLLIDVDNTLIPYDETLPSIELIELFEQLKSLNFKIMKKKRAMTVYSKKDEKSEVK